jgi:hypothetical protein
MRIAIVLGALVITAFVGCMSVQSDVESYSAISDEVSGKNVYITGFDNQNTQSLQWRRNASILAAVLAEKGLRISSSKSTADYIIYMGYGIDEGEVVKTQYAIPQFGVTGYSGGYTTGSMYGSTYSSTTTLIPQYGITGYSTGTQSETVYTRTFAIDMLDRDNGSIVFEGRAVSRGSCGNFSGVAREIISATLSEFPAGHTGSVTVPSEGC